MDASLSSSRFFAPVLLAMLVAGPVAPARAEPSVNRQKELVHLVRQDCGACHGMTLKGGLGPALLPQALAGKPAEGLVATVLGGRPGTPMPPWRRFLTDDEAEWIVAKLVTGFPE